MKRLQAYILKPYQEASYLVEQKAKVLYFSILVNFVFIQIAFLDHVFTDKPLFMPLNDVFFMLMLGVNLWILRSGYLEAAGNFLIILIAVTIFIQIPLKDFFVDYDFHHTRFLEAEALYMAALLLIAIFAVKSYQVYYFTLTGLFVILLDYFIIIERFYGGKHFPLAVADIFTYSAALLLAGFLSNYTRNLLDVYFENLSQESDKVKKLNTELTQKVEARTQALAQQNEELKKANYELDKFVYKVSHDLRAPLLSSLGLVQLIKEEQNEDTRAEYCQMMDTSLNKLDGLIRDILDLSQNARAELKYEALNLRELIEDIFAQNHLSQEEKALHKMLSIKGSEMLYSDELRLGFIFRNLISNAVRYRAQRSEPSFVRITIDNQAGKNCRIQVCDNGQGIEPEHLPKIFDMFYRATQNKPGSGLGLYIVRETLQRLGGSVRVQSTLEEGTCFEISLPKSPH